MATTLDRIQKLVTFSPQLYYIAEIRAKRLGVPFAEYVRHLIIKDAADTTSLPMVDVETNQRIGASLKAIKQGQFTTIDPSNEDQINGLLGLK